MKNYYLLMILMMPLSVFASERVANFVLYDRSKCIEILMRDGCTYEEAVEYFEFNVSGAWVGDRTPGFMWVPEES